ncbi:MAG: transcription/translation regulatory transformer protein RfaH [Pseudohongiellaceae bacterium]
MAGQVIAEPGYSRASSRTGGGPAWYVVHTKARLETVARDHLERQQFQTYLPLIKTTRRLRGKLATLIEPFFPRYLFVFLDQEQDDWSPIRSTKGVVCLVRFNGVARPVPTALITTMKHNEDGERLQQLPSRDWQPGEAVAIEAGPFAGHSGIFESRNSEHRVFLLLNIIGKQTRVSLPWSQIQVRRFA